MQFVWDEELIGAGHRAGLAAAGLEEAAELGAVSARFRERYLPLLYVPGTLEEVEYPGLVRELLGDFGITVDDDRLAAFLEAEHATWDAARVLGATTHALLESL